MKRFCHETQSHDWLQQTLILSLRLYSAVIVEDGGGKRTSTAVCCVTHGLDGAGGRRGSVRQRREQGGGEIKAAHDDSRSRPAEADRHALLLAGSNHKSMFIISETSSAYFHPILTDFIEFH